MVRASPGTNRNEFSTAVANFGRIGQTVACCSLGWTRSRTEDSNFIKYSSGFHHWVGRTGKVGACREVSARAGCRGGGRFQFWDWRDCREESDRLNTQILRLVERLSAGAIDANQIEVTDIRALIGILLHVLGNRKALLVFDNVDQYIDLDTFELVKGLDVLVGEVQSRGHQSLFLFTCRLDVRVDESRALRVPLAGLTEDETTDLIISPSTPRERPPSIP